MGQYALAQHSGERIHAVIINGGMNKLMNHERYWNDCAFLYRTLRQQYHIPKRNFTLLISDGGDPDSDMLQNEANGFASSPDDLDGDGQRDVYQAATLENARQAFADLARQLSPDDHLFLFVIDHGGWNQLSGDAYTYLWGGGRLDAPTLASWLDRFNVATINIVMGQCHAGGFIPHLQRPNTIITTACADNEISWAHKTLPYDEFVYHWTCAIARHDETGTPVNTDYNADGRISMDEAFHYARKSDQQAETPQYCVTPYNLGERWAFDRVLSETELGIASPAIPSPTLHQPSSLLPPPSSINRPPSFTPTGIAIRPQYKGNAKTVISIEKGRKMLKKP